MEEQTSHVMRSRNSSSFQLFSAMRTPPAKRFQRIRNPFEAALADRLHLPLISGSPSLFQRPVTPQFSSTQFEWTIDDVSCLKPTQLEPHETQFHDSPDPDYENKMQSAISSYFKEHQIVPSPVDCPLRSQRIILSELNDNNTPISKPGRRIRDCSTQTELSLPAVLPPALEEALRPYLQSNFSSDDNLYLNPSSANSVDTSLRRKLFDMQNIIVLDNNECKNKTSTVALGRVAQHSNSSPLTVTQLQHTAIMGKLHDSLDKSSFGSLSPISATDGLSISPPSASHESCGGTSAAKKRKSRLPNFLSELLDDVEPLSPIHPPTPKLRQLHQYRCNLNTTTNTTFDETPPGVLATSTQRADAAANEDQNNFTPDRSSSPLVQQQRLYAMDSSFNMRVSRLIVNSAKASALPIRNRGIEADIYAHADDATVDLLELDDEDDMQVSQLSTQSSNCSSKNSSTPHSKRRSASRKNLSISFSNSNWLNQDDDDIEEQFAEAAELDMANQSKLHVLQKNDEEQSTAGDFFYRTDSGFNEMTTASASTTALQHDEYKHTTATTTTSKLVEREPENCPPAKLSLGSAH